MTEFLADVLLLVAILVGALVFVSWRQTVRIDGLERRVDCLERPYGASSVAGRMVHGRFVVTQPAKETRCR